MSWALPMFRLFGADVRIHVIFLLFNLVELLRVAIGGRMAGEPLPLGVAWTAVAFVFLWWVVLLHECGHALAARWMGGASGEYLMWPLGGLAFPALPRSWRAHLVTAVAGPAANLLLFVLLAVVLRVTSGSLSVAVPNVFSHDAILDGLLATHQSWLLTTVFILQWMNTLVLLVNLLPILPFDGGRVLHSILWRSRVYVSAMGITERVGFLLAVLLGLVAFLSTDGPWGIYLITIAFFCGYVCKGMGSRLAFTEHELGMPSSEGWAPVEDDADVVARIGGVDDAKSPRGRDGTHADRVDAILDKVRASGLDSLTRSERRLLKKATRDRLREDRSDRS
jgi:Zn-dependent protease